MWQKTLILLLYPHLTRLEVNNLYIRGHLNNTWHFYGTFLTLPPVWHFSIFADWFYCFLILNEIERKYLYKTYLALWHKVFLPKALKTVFYKEKKLCDTLTTPSECHELFEWLLTHFYASYPLEAKLDQKWIIFLESRASVRV
jgi:hypothetical protein